MKNRKEIELTKCYRNKKVTIFLEFPNEANEKASNDFFSRLKEIYLKKVERKYVQLREFSLQSASIHETESKQYD